MVVMDKSSRNVSIDIAKGLGIMLVVLGHQYDFFQADIGGLFRFVCLFHVPLFFFLSGIFYREQESFLICLKKRFFRLYVPYLLANIFFFLFEMSRACYLGSEYDGSLQWSNLWTSCAGFGPVLSMFARPSWFLLVLFRVFIIYKVLQILTGGNKWMMFVTTVVAGVCGAFWVKDSYLIGQTLVAMPFFSLGHLLNIKFVETSFLFKGGKRCVIGLALSLPLLYYISLNQTTIMALNKYGNILLMFFGALLGILAVIWVSKLVGKMSRLTSSLTFVGRYTLPILIWHMFVMKVVFTAITHFGMNSNAVDNIIAFIVGIILPCAMSMIYTKIKDRIWSR